MDFLTAAKLARDGNTRALYRAVVEKLITAEQRDTVLLWEPPTREWRERREMRSESTLEALITRVWGADAFDGWAPRRHGVRAQATLVEPGTNCGCCGVELTGRQQTFCSAACRTAFKRNNGERYRERNCTRCDARLDPDERGTLCGDCKDAREEYLDGLLEKPCEAHGCDNVAVWSERGRPPKFCSSTCRERDKKRRQRERRRAQRG